MSEEIAKNSGGETSERMNFEANFQALRDALKRLERLQIQALEHGAKSSLRKMRESSQMLEILAQDSPHMLGEMLDAIRAREGALEAQWQDLILQEAAAQAWQREFQKLPQEKRRRWLEGFWKTGLAAQAEQDALEERARGITRKDSERIKAEQAWKEWEEFCKKDPHAAASQAWNEWALAGEKAKPFFDELQRAQMRFSLANEILEQGETLRELPPKSDAK